MRRLQLNMSPLLVLCLVIATIVDLGTATTTVTATNDEHGGGGGGGIESSFPTFYNSYRQCEEATDTDTLSCLKLKALKLVDRALSINNIPIIEGISLAKREDNQRSLSEPRVTAAAAAAATDAVSNNAIDDESAVIFSLPPQSPERNEKLNHLLWKKVKQFVESRSLQLRVNKLLFGSGGGGGADADADADYDYDENANDDLRQSAKFQEENANTTDDVRTAAAAARGKKDKNKGMYMYMMVIKGAMMALAYKGLALLAGKALVVSKIALTLALLVAIKKLFSGGHHSQKTTYEIVKTPIITHSHQYGGGGGPGGPANAQNGHYATDLTGYDGGSYPRSLDEPLQRQRITLKTIDTADADAGAGFNSDSRYTTTRAVASAQARSLTRPKVLENRDGDEDSSATLVNQRLRQLNVPYAHLAAFKKQLTENSTPTSSSPNSSSGETSVNANANANANANNNNNTIK